MAEQASIARTVEKAELQAEIREMYRAVAQNPQGRFPFELGQKVATRLGSSGSVVGIDMTDAQLEKAEAFRGRGGFLNVSFRKGYIEALPLGEARFDAVISNGVFNPSAEKERIFQESNRVLKPYHMNAQGGRP